MNLNGIARCSNFLSRNASDDEIVTVRYQCVRGSKTFREETPDCWVRPHTPSSHRCQEPVNELWKSLLPASTRRVLDFWLHPILWLPLRSVSSTKPRRCSPSQDVVTIAVASVLAWNTCSSNTGMEIGSAMTSWSTTCFARYDCSRFVLAQGFLCHLPVSQEVGNCVARSM